MVESIHAKWDFYGIWVDRGAVLHSSANQNYSGIHVERGTVESNVVVGNSYGSALRNSTYGSNSLQGNGMNLFDYGGNTSQNNNNCDGSTC